MSKMSDTELVERFRDARDQNAFAELVSRYAPMVLATSRSVLGCAHDAEEACQATFMALARAAGSIRRSASVAGWLHKTAMRCAIDVKRSRVRWTKQALDVRQRTPMGPWTSSTFWSSRKTLGRVGQDKATFRPRSMPKE